MKKLIAMLLSVIIAFSVFAVPVSAQQTVTQDLATQSQTTQTESEIDEAFETVDNVLTNVQLILEMVVEIIKAVHELVGTILSMVGEVCPMCGEMHDIYLDVEIPEDPTDPDTPEYPDVPEEPDSSDGKFNFEVLASFGGNVNNIRDSFEAGEIIDLIATAEEGYEFKGWFSNNGGAFESVNATSTKFTMPESNVSVIAKFEKIGSAELTADEEAVNNAYYATEIIYSDGDYADSVINKLTLPISYGEKEQLVNISWTSSFPEVIDSEGNVTRDMSENKSVVLTATFTKGAVSAHKDFTVKVIKDTDINKEEIKDNLITDLEDLNSDSVYGLEIEYNEDNTQIEFISGLYSDIIIDSVESALLSVYSVKSMIGLADPASELVWYNTNHNGKTVAYSFNQVYNGIEVFGRTVTISANAESGKALSLASSIVSRAFLDAVDCDADLSKDSVKEMFSDEVVIDCKLSIYALDEYKETPVLVYVIETADEVIIVNADTSEIVFRYDTTISFGDYSTTGKGKNEQGNMITFPLQFHQWDFWFYYQEDVSRNIELLGGKHSAITKEFNTEWGDETANSAYSNIISAYDYYYNTFGRRSVDNAGKRIEVNVHNKLCNGTNNAHSHGTSGIFCFFDNSNGSLPTTAAGYDIAVHEYTHNVFGNIIGSAFPYANYTGAINEGYADIFACFADNNWVVGEDWNILRNLSDPESNGYPSKLSSANYIENGEVHKNSTIVSHIAYLMSSYGISKTKLQDLWYESMDGGYDATSNFKSVRRYVIQAAKDNNFSDDELAKVRKAFDAVEIFDERCQLKVNIINSENNKVNLSTNNAKITLQRTKQDVPGFSHGVTSGITPVEFNNIYFGEYQMRVEVEGYEPFVGVISLDKNSDIEIDVKLVKAGVARVIGSVTSATTAQPIEGATYKLVEGFNMTFGPIIKQGLTNSSGKYDFEVQAGYYTLIVSKDGYTTGYINITANGGESVTANVSISPTLTGNNFRVVLTWGAYPSDLDSHLFGYPDTGANYHVYYRNENAYNSSGTRIANLDVDDTTSYGPETTTFVIDATGKYEYYIDWYSGSGTWNSCGGHVQVYNGDRLVHEFDAPKVNSQSGSWKVFSVENGIIKAHNNIVNDIY